MWMHEEYASQEAILVIESKDTFYQIGTKIWFKRKRIKEKIMHTNVLHRVLDHLPAWLPCSLAWSVASGLAAAHSGNDPWR
jgi:hypothetical protein